METLQITVVNPKARKLLKNLADMDLIEIEKKKSIKVRLDELSKSLEQHRVKHGNPEPLSMAEIVADVKKTRAEMYAERQKS